MGKFVSDFWEYCYSRGNLGVVALGILTALALSAGILAVTVGALFVLGPLWFGITWLTAVAALPIYFIASFALQRMNGRKEERRNG